MVSGFHCSSALLLVIFKVPCHLILYIRAVVEAQLIKHYFHPQKERLQKEQDKERQGDDMLTVCFMKYKLKRKDSSRYINPCLFVDCSLLFVT